MASPPIRRVLAAIFDTIFMYFALLLCRLWVDILCQGLNHKLYLLFQPHRQKLATRKLTIEKSLLNNQTCTSTRQMQLNDLT